MKTQTKKFIYSLMFLGLITVFGCSPLNKMAELAKQQNMSATPSPLEVHADTVRFEMSVNLPLKMIKEGFTYELNTSYQYGSQERALESFSFKGSDFPNAETEQPRISKSYVFPYEEGMERGQLAFQGVISQDKNGKSKSTEKVNEPRIEGLITTSTMAQPSYYASYADHGYNDQEELNPTNVAFFFDQGRSRLKSTETGSDRGTNFAAFIAQKNVTRTVTITGTHSPEGLDRFNEKLSQERAEAIEAWYRAEMDKYDYQGMADQIRFILKPIVKNWSSLKSSLAGYSGLSSSQKSEWNSIINGSGSFEQKEKQLQKLSSYKQVFTDIYPQLRRAQTEVLTVKEKKSPEQIATLAMQIAQGRTSANELSIAEMAYAAAKNPSLTERKSILEAAAKKNDTWVIHNNLGAVNLELAMQGGDNTALIATALNHFQTSNQKNANVEAQANIGMALEMQGNLWGAHAALSKALGMNPNNNSRRGINGAKGAVEIMVGKYDLANGSLGGATDSSVDQFNKGLAQLLRNDYSNAQATFESVISNDRGYVWAHYAAAVAAARQNNENKVVEHLRNAVGADASLKQKAVSDLEFRNFAESQAFMDILK